MEIAMISLLLFARFYTRNECRRVVAALTPTKKISGFALHGAAYAHKNIANDEARCHAHGTGFAPPPCRRRRPAPANARRRRDATLCRRRPGRAARRPAATSGPARPAPGRTPAVSRRGCRDRWRRI